MKKSLLALFASLLCGAVLSAAPVKSGTSAGKTPKPAVNTPAVKAKAQKPAAQPLKKTPAEQPRRFHVQFRGQPFFDVAMSKLSSSGNAVFSYTSVKGKKTPYFASLFNKAPLTDKWQKFSATFTPSITGEITLSIGGGTRGGKTPAWIFFDKFETKGTRILNSSFEQVYAGTFARWTGNPGNVRRNFAGAPAGKVVAAVCAESSMRQVISVVKNRPVTISFYARKGDDAALEKYSVPNKKVANNHPKKYYRFYDSKTVKYLPLANKGVPGNTINPAYPWITPGRRPALTIQYPENKRAGKFRSGFIPFELLEESNISRTADVKFGFPFKRGDIYNMDNLSVLSPAGNAVPAQFTAISFWPDRSIKFVLAEFRAKLKAKERSKWKLAVNSGKKVPALPVLKCVLHSDGLEIDTGRLQTQISKTRFNFLRNIKVDGKPVGAFDAKGLEVVGENKKLYTSSGELLKKLYIESSGPLALTIRAEGEFAENMGRFICRMTFRAGSPVVDFSIRYQNVDLTNEFHDIRSLKFSYVPRQRIRHLRMEGVNCQRIFQHHDRKLQIDKRIFNRMMGDGGSAGNITYAFRDAAKRYPKAFSVSSRRLHFELLPEQPGVNFGRDLPFYLQYPFCQGLYRMKWGMGFTEELTIDFSGRTRPSELAAKRVIPVIDRDYLRRTGVFTGIPRSKNNPFAEVDAKAVEAFYRHMNQKVRQREYGFLNWGDSFGERGRNWTNNEYDFAHGLFMLFLRTGNRDLFRWAMTASRHQADVDIIHAYPDPAYIGANVQHGVGHTGQNYGGSKPAVWSRAYNASDQGWNGHTWSEGMTEAWLLGGDAISMESAILLGEHLVNYIAPQLKRLSTHERTAGWAATALLGIYRATGNRRYLNAAGLLINLILDEQKHHLGGAWPHKLPADHANGYKDSYGNCPYLVGIVIHALRQYHEQASSRAVRRSVMAASNWLWRGLDKQHLGWSYGTGYDGRRFWPARRTLNLLIAPAMMSGGRFSNDRRIYDSARLLLHCAAVTGFSASGKGLAMELCTLPVLIEEMERMTAQNRRAGRINIPPAELARLLDNRLSDRFHLRGPDQITFDVTASKPSEIVILRTSSAGSPKAKPEFTCKVVDSSKKVIRSFKGKIRARGEWKVKLPAKGRYTVEISDSCSGAWNVLSRDCRVRAGLRKGYFFHNSGISRQLLIVPKGTKAFTLEFFSVRPGSCQVLLLDGKGRLAGNGKVVSSRYRFPWSKGAETQAKGRIRIKLAKPAPKETAWKMIILANNEVRLDLKGAKGEIALSHK